MVHWVNISYNGLRALEARGHVHLNAPIRDRDNTMFSQRTQLNWDEKDSDNVSPELNNGGCHRSLQDTLKSPLQEEKQDKDDFDQNDKHGDDGVLPGSPKSGCLEEMCCSSSGSPLKDFPQVAQVHRFT